MRGAETTSQATSTTAATTAEVERPGGGTRRSPMRRVVVVGTSCSGKSTFARDLAAALGVPPVHLDELYWLPGWRERPTDDFRRRTADVVASDGWVVDGNSSVIRDLVWSRATHVVWLDFPLALVFGRALRRTVGRVVTGERVCGGNRETFRHAFLSRDSILLWVLRSFARNRRTFTELAEGGAFAGLEWFRLRRPAEAAALLAAATREVRRADSR